ncbi:MAG: tyrosine-type recombinase/integrase [Nitrospirae bacterium]|nr:tyrosine-type recombinase/integrase [Nitrospirota bacterium]
MITSYIPQGHCLLQYGIDLYVVKELLGHKTITMTMRYAHHNPESLRHGVEVLDKSGDILVTVGDKAKISVAVTS